MSASQLSHEAVQEWLAADNWVFRITVERLREGEYRIPLSVIECGLMDTDVNVRHAAAEACRGRRDIPLEVIISWMRHGDATHRHAAMVASIGRPEVPFELIESNLSGHSSGAIELAAAKACRGRRDISLTTIEQWFASEDWHLKLAAMEASSDRDDVPFDLIERGLDIGNAVSAAARRAAAHRGRIFRAFEPRDEVYQHCINEVTVVASIPDDAHIVGHFGGECRASKAIIRDIIGGQPGKKIGICAYEQNRIYRIGDKIEYLDFDFGNTVKSKGFRFYNTLEEAKGL